MSRPDGTPYSKYVRVFEALKHIPEGMSPGEIAVKLGKSRQSSVTALLTMEAKGLLLWEDEYGMLHAYENLNEKGVPTCKNA